MARRAPGLPELPVRAHHGPARPYTRRRPSTRVRAAPDPDHTGQDPRYDFKEPLDRDRLVAQYDGEIAYGDQEFGRFLQELKARGLYDRALIVFIADHGEEFEDHGKWLHGRSVFDELIRIPLLVKFPGQKDGGKRIAQQVQTVDVLPTVLEHFAMPVPAAPVITGHPLQAVVAGGAPEPPAVSEISHRGFVAHGMRTTKDKYVRRFSPEEDELYFDLRKDPKEQQNLIEQNRERVRLLKAGVEAAMVPNPFRYTVRFEAPGTYHVLFRTGGWIEGVQPVAFGPGDKHDLDGNGRKLIVSVAPKPGQPREIAFGLRPQGAPVTLEGTRDGKPSHRPTSTSRRRIHREVPFKLPRSRRRRSGREHLRPRRREAGVHVAVRAVRPSAVPMPKDACEQKALGYMPGLSEDRRPGSSPAATSIARCPGSSSPRFPSRAGRSGGSC